MHGHIDDSKDLEPSADFLAAEKLREEIRNLKASTNKARWEAANARAQNRELIRRRSFYERILSTTQATIVLALITLLFQILQFGYTARETRKYDEEKQWKDTVKDVHLDDEAKTISSALSLETFFNSKEHSAEARTMVAVLLPYLRNHDAFDHVFIALLNKDGWNGPYCLTCTVTKSVDLEYANLADLKYGGSHVQFALQGRYREQLSEELINDSWPKDQDIKEAQDLEWQIDTLTRGLVDFWRRHGTKPPTAGSDYTADLQTIILRQDGDSVVDLQGLDFSRAYFKNAYLRNVRFSNGNLTGAILIDADLGSASLDGVRLDGAKVDGANFDGVTSFGNSSWNEVQWWNAAAISAPLCDYLKRRFNQPPAGTAPKCASK